MKRITTHQAVAIFIAVPVVFFIFLSFNFFGIFGGGENLASDIVTSPTQDGNVSAGSLVVDDTVVGDGDEARNGTLLTVHYVGALTDGRVFDSSAERGPFQFVLGASQVIPGWDRGLLGMREGGRRTLIVPPSLAYGEAGIGPIPPNSTLIFEVELLEVSQPQ